MGDTIFFLLLNINSVMFCLKEQRSTDRSSTNKDGNSESKQ